MKIAFYELHDLDDTGIRLVQGTVGLYFIYVPSLRVPYPFAPSGLIYIGMSESRQNSIGRRLQAHKKGRSGNVALGNYIARRGAKFTYLTVDVLKALASTNVLELESFFLQHFMVQHGAYPICNNQSGVLFPGTRLEIEGVGVDWKFFS
jgi:hypothetical protein